MDEFTNNSAETSRRLDNLIKIGTIAEIDLVNARARVKTGNLTSDFLPWLSSRAGNVRSWAPPFVGEQVILLSASGETGSGVILMGLFSQQFAAPDNSADTHVFLYPDGARIEYNYKSSALNVKGIKTADVQASEKCTVNCPKSEFSGDVEIKGKLLVNGLFSYMSGMSGLNGNGGTTQINGDFRHRGSFENQGDVSSNGVSLSGHTHSGDSGGTTSPPNG